MQRRKFLIRLACSVAAAACPMGARGQSLEVLLAAGPFDEEQIVLKMGVLSDLHVSYPMGEAYQKTVSALEQLKARAGGKLDAVFVAGDLTDTGSIAELSALKAAVTSQLDLTQTPFVFAIGNHEYYGGPVEGGARVKEVFGDLVYQGASEEEVKSANYHTAVNGYHLIAVNCAQYDGGVKYREQDLEWLRAALAQARAEGPGQPIFVASHPMITGTNWGAEEDGFWSAGDLMPILNEYPEAIYFAGHLHYPLNNERTIWQGGFTTAGTASVYYGSTDQNDPQGNAFLDIVSSSETSDAHQFSQGYYLEVDAQNNVRLTRMDFYRNAAIKQPWIIPAPCADRSHLAAYTDARRRGNRPPRFPQGAAVWLASVDTESVIPKMNFEFTQAQDDDVPMSYQVSFVDAATGRPMKTVAVYSDYYRQPQASNMAATMTATAAITQTMPMNIPCEKDYYIELSALDCWGAGSSSIRSEVIKGVPKPPEDPRDKVGLEVHKDWDFKLYSDFDAFGPGYQIKHNSDYNSMPVNTPQAATHPPVERNGYQGSAAWPTQINSEQDYYDLIFTQPGRGFAEDFPGAKEFWIWIDSTQAPLGKLYFGFRTRALYGGDEFRTDQLKGMSGLMAYLEDGAGGWRAAELDTQGVLTGLGAYRGFIRFDARYFYDRKMGASMIPLQLKGLVVGFTPVGPQAVGHTLIVDHVGFAGPSMPEATCKAGDLKLGTP